MLVCTARSPAVEDTRMIAPSLRAFINGKRRTAQVKDGVDVDIKRSIPVVRRKVEELAIDRAAGGMHEHVERADFIRGFLDATRGVRPAWRNRRQ